MDECYPVEWAQPLPQMPLPSLMSALMLGSVSALLLQDQTTIGFVALRRCSNATKVSQRIPAGRGRRRSPIRTKPSNTGKPFQPQVSEGALVSDGLRIPEVTGNSKVLPKLQHTPVVR